MVKGVPKIYYGTVAIVSADNPASNSLGGFKESTAAYRYCRQCMATSTETKNTVMIGHGGYLL